MNEYLGATISEMIITKLNRLPELQAIPFPYGSEDQVRQKSLRKKLIDLDINFTLEIRGCWLESGDTDTVKIDSRLAWALHDNNVWVMTYEGKGEDIVLAEDSIALKVAEGVGVESSDEKKALLFKRYTENSRAYLKYFKGRWFWDIGTEDALKTSIQYFEEAIEIYPDYAMAYVGKADAYRHLVQVGPYHPREFMLESNAAALKALHIDRECAGAHEALGCFKLFYEWKWDDAEVHFKRAIELNPNSWNAYLWYAQLLCRQGRHQEAISEIEKARELNPLSRLISTNVGWRYTFAGDYTRAIAEYKEVLSLYPDYWAAHWGLGRTYTYQGNYREAIDELQSAVDINGEKLLEPLADLGYVYALSGDTAKAREVISELSQLKARESEHRYIPSFYFAVVYLGLGEDEQVFDWLGKAFLERDFRLTHIGISPEFDRLRGDPRFKSLLRKVGLEK